MTTDILLQPSYLFIYIYRFPCFLSFLFFHIMSSFHFHVFRLPFHAAVGMYPHVRRAVENGEVLLEWDYSKGKYAELYTFSKSLQFV